MILNLLIAFAVTQSCVGFHHENKMLQFSDRPLSLHVFDI